MLASMAMPAGRTRMRTAKLECALLVAVLGMFIPGFAHAETSAADAVKSGQQAAPPRAAPAKPHAQPAPPSGKGAPRKTGSVDARPKTRISAANASPRAGTRLSRAVTTTPSTRAVMTKAGPAAMTARPTQNLRAVTVRHAATSSRGATNVSGTSGNTLGRRAPSTAVIGGPAKYDAKHGAVISGTVTGRKR
jgi:hypothetical protein